MANVTFDSQKPLPSFSKPGTFISSSVDQLSVSSEELLKGPLKVLECFTVRLKEWTGLTLIGYDVFISEADGSLYVIDVNYFPSYREFPNFAVELRRYLRKRCKS